MVLSLLTTSVPAASLEALEKVAPDSFEVIAVSGRRLKPADSGQAVTVVRAAGPRLDTALGAVPGLTLFRRADSLTAHPTTQGLSMRGVGANAAGRVLVTLDGVPVGDPFGGWVYWSAFSPADIGTVRVLKGGAPGSFGAQALVGAVALESNLPSHSGGHASAQLGNNDTALLTGGFTLVDESDFFRLSAGHFDTAGAYLLARADRGTADARAASSSDHVTLSGRIKFGDGTTIMPSVRWYHEDRVNGLAIATNETEAVDASLRLNHTDGDGRAYELIGYYRTRDFSNIFASVADDRNSTQAVLDQYDVPGWSAGMLVRLQMGALEVGIDGRRMSGETNEHFRNLGDGFTRNRTAGGDQWTLGAYAEAGFDYDGGSVAATIRLDRWRSYHGMRSESDLADGAVLRDDDIADQAGWQPSARLGVEHAVTRAINLRGAAYRSWRLPTLNEYYRPFRVGNDITEANADLKPEKLYGLEIGLDYEPLNTARASLTLFRNWLEDGVGNVTIGVGPGFFPLGGFVPAGGVLRQRANIGRTVTDGFELDGELRLQPGWTFGLSYLYARARITGFDAMPDLVGKRPAQTPRHSLTARVQYQPGSAVSLHGDLRIASSQYDDDQNTRRLGAGVTLNGGASYRLSDTVRLTADIENLFDAKVVSALAADGLETLARRRAWRAGLSANF